MPQAFIISLAKGFQEERRIDMNTLAILVVCFLIGGALRIIKDSAEAGSRKQEPEPPMRAKPKK